MEKPDYLPELGDSPTTTPRIHGMDNHDVACLSMDNHDVACLSMTIFMDNVRRMLQKMEHSEKIKSVD